MTTSSTLPSKASKTWESPAHKRTVYGVLAIVAVAILFDGYDLVIYGAVLPNLLADPTQIGQLSPAVAGTLGSWAMIGVTIGALSAGAIGDRLGRRRVFLTAIAWFSLGMALTALSTSVLAFGVLRFFTGLGVGIIVATGGAIVAEFAPAGRRNFFNAIAYSGVPAGGVMAYLAALALEDAIGWRGLFMIGATPIVFLLPLAWFLLPESPKWLVATGRSMRAQELCRKFGLPESQFLTKPVSREAAAKAHVTPSSPTGKSGFAAIFSRVYLPGTLLIGTMSFMGLLSTYGLNTWLPVIMENNGASAAHSMYTLLFLNGGAVVGGLFASMIADRVGAKAVITVTFTLAAISLMILPFTNNVYLTYIPIVIAGVGVLGTQVLTYGLTSNYFDTSARAAGVAWCAGFGRLGGIVGPMATGLMIGAGFGPTWAFGMFAGVAVIGVICTVLIPKSPAVEQVISTEPTASPHASAKVTEGVS